MMYFPVPNLFLLAESIFTGQIYFHWPNLFSLVESILWHLWCTSQHHKTDFFPNNPSLKKGFVYQCGTADFVGVPLISSNKVVKSISSSNKALIITFMLKNAN